MQLSVNRQRTFDRLRMHPQRPEWPQWTICRHRMDRVLGVAFPYDSQRRVPSVSESPAFVLLQLSRESRRARRVSRPESIRLADLPRHEDPRDKGHVVPPFAESRKTDPGQVSSHNLIIKFSNIVATKLVFKWRIRLKDIESKDTEYKNHYLWEFYLSFLVRSSSWNRFAWSMNHKSSYEMYIYQIQGHR